LKQIPKEVISARFGIRLTMKRVDALIISFLDDDDDGERKCQ
jgi:hypothetical protein